MIQGIWSYKWLEELRAKQGRMRSPRHSKSRKSLSPLGWRDKGGGNVAKAQGWGTPEGSRKQGDCPAEATVMEEI